jgi:hypothetical protein
VCAGAVCHWHQLTRARFSWFECLSPRCLSFAARMDWVSCAGSIHPTERGVGLCQGRQLFALVVVLLISAAWVPSASALKVSGYLKSPNSWQYLTRFCFLPTNFQTASSINGQLKATFRFKADSRLSLLEYLERPGDEEYAVSSFNNWADVVKGRARARSGWTRGFRSRCGTRRWTTRARRCGWTGARAPTATLCPASGACTKSPSQVCVWAQQELPVYEPGFATLTPRPPDAHRLGDVRRAAHLL